MEKVLKQTLVFLSVLLLANTGWCFMIGTTDVGGLDTFLGITDALPNSSPGSETDWINTILDPDAEYDTKNEPVDYFMTDTADIYAFPIIPTPPVSEYFVIKNAQYWALYANNVDHSWGVFDTALLPSDMNLPSSTLVISHVTRFDGDDDTPPGTPIPEPATIFLLGTGLIGMAGVGRKRFMK